VNLALEGCDAQLEPMKETVGEKILIAGFVLATIAIGTFAQKPVNDASLLDSVTPTPNLYHDDADAKKEIEAALKSSVSTNKRILLIFGANWCYDCHVLDQALHQGEAGKIVSESFLLVHVDIGEGEKNLDLVKLYKIPLEKGVPALAVLEGDGHLLYSSGQGEFEAARRMMKKDLIQFLRHWQKQNRSLQNRRRP
jgi:thiol:disulfide interchange protein